MKKDGVEVRGNIVSSNSLPQSVFFKKRWMKKDVSRLQEKSRCRGLRNLPLLGFLNKIHTIKQLELPKVFSSNFIKIKRINGGNGGNSLEVNMVKSASFSRITELNHEEVSPFNPYYYYRYHYEWYYRSFLIDAFFPLIFLN